MRLTLVKKIIRIKKSDTNFLINHIQYKELHWVKQVYFN